MTLLPQLVYSVSLVVAQILWDLLVILHLWEYQFVAGDVLRIHLGPSVAPPLLRGVAICRRDQG